MGRIAENSAVIERILAEVERVRAERGMESYASGSPTSN
jgi:hypothetical protein